MATALKKPKEDKQALNAAMIAAMDKPAMAADLLTKIRASALELTAAVKTVKTLEGQLQEAQSRVHQLRITALPQLMDEAQIPGLDVDEETRVERDTEYYASISKDNQAKAAAWLRANNLGSIVKEAILIPIDKGDTERVKQVTSILTKAKISFAESSSVHPQTLKALVRERLEEGKPLPASITYHTQPVVNVKVIKPSKRKGR